MRTSSLAHDNSLHALSRVVYKRRRLAGIIFLVVFAYAAAGTLTAPRIYEARARLLIEARDQQVLSFRQVVQERGRPNYYRTQHGILQSRSMARRTLDAMQGWDTPPFGGPVRASRFNVRRAIFGLPSRVLAFVRGSGNAEPSERPGDETRAQSRAVSAFVGRLVVAPISGSQLVDLRFRDADPSLAAAAANALAASYIESHQESRFLASREANAWLNERLVEQRAAVEASEEALQAYRERHGAVPLDARDSIVVQQLGDLNAALTRAKTVRIEKEALRHQLQASRGDTDALDAFPAILSNGFIQEQKAALALLEQQQARLSETLGHRHPDMQNAARSIAVARTRLDGEIAKIIEAANREYQAALSQEQSLAAALNRQKADALAMSRTAIGYGALEREVESSTRLYTTLLQRAEQTEVAGQLRATNVRVVDPAERPVNPVLPRTANDLLAGVVGGLALAIGAVLAFDYLDRRIRTPDDIREHLHLPSLGMLPLVPHARGVYPLLSAEVSPGFAEAVRTLRTSVLFAMPDERCRVVSVTSTGIGEGKSTVSSNLAVALAEAGQRVLLIDADMRKPKVHDVFGIRQTPGLSDVLTGQSDVAMAIRGGVANGLFLLGAGTIPPNPAELIGAPAFRALLEARSVDYDWVIIDAPPVMAVTDASLIGRWSGGVVFVVGADMTNRRIAGVAVAQLARGANVIGAVLNRTPVDRDPHYYARYYGREYSRPS